MKLQEDAMENAMKADRMFWIALFFIFIKIIIPLVKHSIKHRWIFVLLGFVASAIIHSALYEIISNFNHLFAFPIYATLIPLGIYATVSMRRRDHMKKFRSTKPLVPAELYSYDENY